MMVFSVLMGVMGSIMTEKRKNQRRKEVEILFLPSVYNALKVSNLE